MWRARTSLSECSLSKILISCTVSHLSSRTTTSLLVATFILHALRVCINQHVLHADEPVKAREVDVSNRRVLAVQIVEAGIS